MFPIALVCGNTFVVKPSEFDPGATMMLAEMAKESGVPNGVVNVIHGQKDGKETLVNFVHMGLFPSCSCRLYLR